MSFLALIFSFLVIINGGAFNQASLGTLTATVSINPLSLSVTAPDEVKIDRNFIVKAEIKNKGEVPVEDTEIEIYLSQGLKLVRKDAKQMLGIIPAHRKKLAFWQIRGEEFGTYVILVKAQGEINGQEIEVEASTIVKVAGKKSSWWQQLLTNFWKNVKLK